MSLETAIKAATSAYQNSQTELSKLVTTRQKLDSQYNENLAVKTEFDQLPNNNDDVKPEDRREVYKLIANVLIKQDIGESKSNVNRRIEFLKTEQSKVDQKITTLQTEIEKQKLELIHLQTQLQQQQETAQAGSNGAPTSAIKSAV